MKFSMLLLVLIELGCKAQNSDLLNKNISKKILAVQSKNRAYAISSYLGREQLVKKHIISNADTLFLIERVTDVDLKLWSTIWTSKRDKVVEYSNETGPFRDTSFTYQGWHEPLKDFTEKYDTTSIDKHPVLGGYRTFITQVIGGKQIKTFFFQDATSSLRRSPFGNN